MKLRTAASLLAFVAVTAAAQQLELRPVASGLTSPVSIAHAGDTRLFITQQDGKVMIFDGARVLETPFLDVSPLITTGGERGLLSVAFHPRYAANGFFYVNYTDLRGDTVVARYSVPAADPSRADSASAVVLLRIPQPFANHNGGQLQFGPDGYLYVGTGDGGSGGDPGNRAQNLGDLLGKILRIDVDAPEPRAPASNPFIGTAAARPEIWAYGLRNPWRFTFDRATGDLWIADVGQGQWEEVNFQSASSPGGENYGWRRMEGTHCFNPSSGCEDPSLVRPVLEYGHTGGACSVTGGYVYRGAFRKLQGVYLYGDFCNGMIWGASRGEGGWSSRLLADTSLLITTFGEDVAGEVYVADFRGTVYRLVDASATPPKRRSVRH